MDEQQIKELKADQLKIQELHRKAVEKHNAEIKTLKDAVKVLKTKEPADTAVGSEEIKKLNEAFDGISDKIKTIMAQREADKKYNTVAGLAEHFADSNPTEKRINFHQMAKSILDDPFKDSYKSAFLMKLKDPRDEKNTRAKLNEKVQEIKGSSVSGDESFIKKNLTTIIGEEAGYLCPPEIDLNIQKVLYETSPLRQVATVRNITRGHYEFLIRTSLPNAKWENDEQDEPDITGNQKYQMGKIAVHKLTAQPIISLDMLEDSVINIEAELRNDLREAFMLAENTAFIKGAGEDRPTGIVTYAQNGAEDFDPLKPLKMKQVGFDLSDYNGADGSVHLADALLNMNAALLSAYKRNAIYLISRQLKNVIRQVKDKQNQYLFSVGQNWGGVQGVPQIRDGRHGMINGYGVLECDDLESTLKVNTYPMFFGDFAGYIILDRIGMRLIKDEVTSKGQVKYWFRKRVGAGFKFLQGVVALKVNA